MDGERTVIKTFNYFGPFAYLILCILCTKTLREMEIMAYSKHGASSTGFVKKAAAALIALILALSVLGVNVFADDEIMTADQLASLTIAAG